MIKAFPHQSSQRDVRSAVNALTSKYTLEYWDRHDGDKEFPEEFAQDFADSGFSGILIPEQYGGGGGTIADLCAALEEVAAGGGGLNACASVHIPMLCVPTLLAFGSEAQRQEYLPKIATGDVFVTFGITEPDAGTDTTKISTSARRTQDGYLLSGTKVWNSGALRGDKILVLARTSTPSAGQRKGDGLTLFLTDLRADTVDIHAIPKIGRNAVASAEVFFRDHPVSDSEVVGEVGKGFYHLLHSLNGERLYLAAEAMGIGRWCLQAATKYAGERVVFDRAIGMNQAVQHPLAKSYLSLLAAGQVLQAAICAYQMEGAGAIGGLANAAKYLTTEAAWATADEAMQTFGGYSFAREYHIGRHWIEVRLQRIAPVNNQMILNFISEKELGLPRSY